MGRHGEVGVYWGRFNPPHKGHLSVIRRLKNRCRLVVAIGSSEHHDERKDPFTGAERARMMRAYLKESGIRGVRVITLRDGPSWSWALDNLIDRCKPDVLFLSAEKRRLRSMVVPKVKVVPFRRSGKVSSTRIRDAIAAGDPLWEHLTGASVGRLIVDLDGISRIQKAYGARRKKSAHRVRIVRVRLPEYTTERPPDYLRIGKKVDRVIERNFPDGKYILRAIGLDGHPGKTLSDLTRVVQETGSDKYDPTRRAVGQEEFAGYDYDIQAGPVEIRGGRVVVDNTDSGIGSIFGGVARHFYEGAALDRGHSVRIDLLLFYDPSKVVRARKRYPRAKVVRRGLNRFLYKFTEPRDKKSALLGLVKILRR